MLSALAKASSPPKAKLALYFGGAIPDHNLNHHREHIAIEHINWYRRALQSHCREG